MLHRDSGIEFVDVDMSQGKVGGPLRVTCSSPLDEERGQCQCENNGLLGEEVVQHRPRKGQNGIDVNRWNSSKKFIESRVGSLQELGSTLDIPSQVHQLLWPPFNTFEQVPCCSKWVVSSEPTPPQ